MRVGVEGREIRRGRGTSGAPATLGRLQTVTRPRSRAAGTPATPANKLGRVRVIAGEYRGRVLVAPRGRETRPTSDRVREALFSILADVRGARVLDLFAGSGALGIEALSRGAARATFVDSSAAAVAAIQRNMTSLGLEADVRRRTAASFLDCAREAGRQYDLVFLDPPYRHASNLGRALSTPLAPVLAPDARVIAESDRRAPIELEMELLDERRYGDTLIQIYGP